MNQLVFILNTISINLQLSSTSIWDDPMILFYTVVGFIFITAVLILVVAFFLLQVLRQLTKEASIDAARQKGVEWKEEPSFWSKLMEWSNRSVPVEKEETVMLDHNYDGIRELDNFLPPWWKWLFYATIIWGGVYLAAYHLTETLPLQTAEYEQEVSMADAKQRLLKASVTGPVIDETNVEQTTDPAALADGKSTYTSICSSCHRMDGGGDIGPNLTDDYWKHGGDIRSVYVVVSKGVTGTNMIAWGSSLSPEKIRNVSSYLLSLRGTNPPNAKKPEGELFKAQAAQDSAVVKAVMP